MRPHQTQGQVPALRGLSVHRPVTHLTGGAVRRRRGIANRRERQQALHPTASEPVARPQTRRTTLPAPCSPHPLLPGSPCVPRSGDPKAKETQRCLLRAHSLAPTGQPKNSLPVYQCGEKVTILACRPDDQPDAEFVCKTLREKRVG